MIDSHHHLWNYDPIQYPWITNSMEVLKRDFALPDLKEAGESCGLSGVVTVQAQQSVAEAEWLLDLSERDDFIKGVVAWVPLMSDETELTKILDRLSGHSSQIRSKLKGVRHVVQDETDDHFLAREDFNRGIALLRNFDIVYDILIYGTQLPMTIPFVDRHPEQLFVLDHIAKPAISAHSFDHAWAANLTDLARRQNVVCKFSGIVTEVRDPDWSAELLAPYWHTMLEAFGPERVMYGSDWPVCLLRTGYDHWVAAVKTLSTSLSPTEQNRFWSENATEYYKL